jgi:ATP-dependent Clp protease ATP-binding subunit ClpA
MARLFNRFTRTARAVVQEAQGEARALGARTIDAEHLLLALSACPALREPMETCGAGHDALVEALELEVATALQTVGISVADYGPPPPVPVFGDLRFGTSAKRALEQTLRVAVRRDDHRIEAGHLLLALLQMERGTVPRALELAGVNSHELADRAAATL